MGDLLVKLYGPPQEFSPPAGVTIQRPLAPDRKRLAGWVDQHFGDRWASEVEVAFSGHPITCLMAHIGDGSPLGFACYDTSFRGFFGPLGVVESARGKGIGTALLRRGLAAMFDAGYAYAVIGYSGADDYYRETVGAIPIPDSEPGPYRGWIKRDDTSFSPSQQG